MIEQYQTGSDARLASPRPYGLGLGHKHLPEMATHSRLETAPIFIPVVADFYKGLAVTIPLPLVETRRGTTAEHVHAALAERYADERFIAVAPLRDPETLAEGFFDVQACNDTNRVELFVFGNESQLVLLARLDNLGKGASGAAVQSMNVHLGVDEGIGL